MFRSIIPSILLGLFASAAIAGDLVFASGFDERHTTGTHYVLIYQDGRNAWHTCSGNDHNYHEWTDYGTAIRSGCSFSHHDTDSYPPVYPLDVYTVWMDNSPTTCRYVASTGPAPGSGDTQVTIDCRNY